MWQVLPHLARQVGKAIRAAGGGEKGFNKVRKAHPKWFTKTPPRQSTKLDNRTGKPVSGSGAKGSKATSAPKATPRKKSYTKREKPIPESKELIAAKRKVKSGKMSLKEYNATQNHLFRNWSSVPNSIRSKLEAGNTKGFTKDQLAKYRVLYKNRAQ